MTHTKHLWYDGHHGYIECIGRARYESYLNGEEFNTDSNPDRMKHDLITEMKYRVERDPDFPTVCHGVLVFLDNHVPGQNDENEYVLFDSVQEEVILNDHALALEVINTLKMDDYIEMIKAYDSPNYQYLLRPTVDEIPEAEELSGELTKLWA